MRVIAGIAKSLPLNAPDGMDTRPTTDRIKETLFNIINQDLADCVFVDFFSGSGGIGIEALSRGAKKVYFVEQNRKALDCIKANLLFTKLIDNSIILAMDILAAVDRIAEKKVDIIFMDPPYASNLENGLLKRLADASYVTENTLLIVEAGCNKSFDFVKEYGFSILREKNYKTNKHVFLMKKQDEEM